MSDNEDTFESFMRRFVPPDGRYTLIDVTDDAARWPYLVVRFGSHTAVIQCCGLPGPDAHLSLDIHAFVEDRATRAGVFGIEDSVRYPGFPDGAAGTSHGWPALRSIAVLIGTQATTAPANTPRYETGA